MGQKGMMMMMASTPKTLKKTDQHNHTTNMDHDACIKSGMLE